MGLGQILSVFTAFVLVAGTFSSVAQSPFGNNFVDNILVSQAYADSADDLPEKYKNAVSIEGSILTGLSTIGAPDYDEFQMRIAEGFSNMWCFPQDPALDDAINDPRDPDCPTTANNIEQLFELDVGINKDGEVRTVDGITVTGVEDPEPGGGLNDILSPVNFFLIDNDERQESQAIYKDNEGEVKIEQTVITLAGSKGTAWEMTFTNEGSTDIANLDVGIYWDWDLATEPSFETGFFDSTTDTLVVFKNNSAISGIPPNIFAGVSSDTTPSHHDISPFFETGSAAHPLTSPNDENGPIGLPNFTAECFDLKRDLTNPCDLTVTLIHSFALAAGASQRINYVAAVANSEAELATEIQTIKDSLPTLLDVDQDIIADDVFSVTADVGDVAANETIALEFDTADSEEVIDTTSQATGLEFTTAEEGDVGDLTVTTTVGEPEDLVDTVSPLLTMVIDIDQEVEDTEDAIDVSDEDSFVGDITFSFTVDINFGSSALLEHPDGCPRIEVFLLNETTGTQELVGEADRDSANDVLDSGGGIAECAYTIILPHFSRFSVGGRATPNSGGSWGGDTTELGWGNPESTSYDNLAPIIEECVVAQTTNLEISCMITDTVAVKDANIVRGKSNTYPMVVKPGNALWWDGLIPATDLPDSGTVFYKVVARDFNDNIAEFEDSVEIQAGGFLPGEGSPSFMIKPLSGQASTQQNYAITATAANLDNPDLIPEPQITIKNTGDEPLKNIRVMLSPELKGKFLLSDYAIRNVAPDDEVTISLTINGKPSVDVNGNPLPYKGMVFISINNSTPYVLNISGYVPNDSVGLRALFMKMVADKAEDRYRSMELPDDRISQSENYQVNLASGGGTITSASDSVIITNTGENPLKNIRVMTSLLSNHFLPDHNNIKLLPAGSFIKVKLLSKLNEAESPNLKGELLVVPETGLPMTIPIDIGEVIPEDVNSKYEVTTISGDEFISNTADGIVIKNNSDEAVKNVRLMVPKHLAGVFSLSEDSFKSIEPDAEKVVMLEQRGTVGSIAKQILNDYNGEIIIVSENGMKKVVPVDIAWKSISSEHFIVYARNQAGELLKATQLINFLERNYDKVTEITGETVSKTEIYLPTSLDELKTVADSSVPSTYVFGEDDVFVWSGSDDINALALKEFTYRMIVKAHASYWTKEILMENGSWLTDGLSNYIAAKIVGERAMIRDQVNAFIEEPTSFEWYGKGTQSQYGATYMLLKQLSAKYGDDVIEKALTYLGSSMVSNDRCSTPEQCVLLRAAYSAASLDIDDAGMELDFNALVDEWKADVDPLIIDKLNTFQKAELEKAVAKQNANLPLTLCEKSALGFTNFLN
ncbi:MAG: hypothetical protein ACE5KA_07655 [Nitrososphaerales archaeon]